MAKIRLQGSSARRGVYYEYDDTDAPIGLGGTGIVYRGYCYNESNGACRKVAIKILHDDVPTSIIARSRREAAMVIHNENVIEMLDFIEQPTRTPSGHSIARYYVISEYVSGVSLKSLLRGDLVDDSGNIVPLAQELYDLYQSNREDFAMTIVGGVLEALKVLHQCGYIHRDIDPSNIIISENGIIKLIDLGIARKFAGNNDDGNQLTMPGSFVGKPRYAAPELVRGLLDDQRPPTDIYAVGILLFQLCTGHLPFEGELYEILQKQVDEPMPISEISNRGIRKIIAKATFKEFKKRYQSAQEMLDALAQLTMAASNGKRHVKSSSGNSTKTVIMALIGCIVVGIATFAILKLTDNRGSHTIIDVDVEDEIEITSDEYDDADPELINTYNYRNAMNKLMSKSTAQSGLDELTTLANNGNPDAMFMLSRLFFSSNDNVALAPLCDTISTIRRNITIPVNNSRAHQLLLRVVQIQPNNYRALFELGCDYKSNRRGVTRDLNRAKDYLNRAYRAAQQAGNSTYANAASSRMSNIN